MTNREFLNTLEDEVKEKVLAQMMVEDSLEDNEDYLDEEFEDAWVFLAGIFIFNRMPEGFEYWQDVCNNTEKYQKHE